MGVCKLYNIFPFQELFTEWKSDLFGSDITKIRPSMGSGLWGEGRLLEAGVYWVFCGIFCKTLCLEVQNFSSVHSDFYAILVRFMLWGQEKWPRNVKECKSSWPLSVFAGPIVVYWSKSVETLKMKFIAPMPEPMKGKPPECSRTSSVESVRRWTDGRYQVLYLPASLSYAVDKYPSLWFR